MAIVATDIKKYLSGGAANSNVNLSLGGAISSVEIVDNTLHNLFDKVTGTESEAGNINYRAFFVKNTHATLTYEAVKVYIQTNTPSATTEVKIALAGEAGSPIETIALETTAPVGESFVTADGLANGLSIGDLAPGAVKGIWVKWEVTAGSLAVADSVTLEFSGDTNP
jgi:hypothetical protein